MCIRDRYYRGDLRSLHLVEAMDSATLQLKELNEQDTASLETYLKKPVPLHDWLEQVKQHLVADTLNSQQIRTLIALIIYLDCDLSVQTLNSKNQGFMQAC